MVRKPVSVVLGWRGVGRDMVGVPSVINPLNTQRVEHAKNPPAQIWLKNDPPQRHVTCP